MTVKELEDFLGKVKDKDKGVYFYGCDENPFEDGIGIGNAFDVSKDQANTGAFEGVYIQGT